MSLINSQSQALSLANNHTKFTSKNLLEWIKITYKIELKNIEHCCTGAVYCQILDSIHPGKVKMNKVNWKAKLEHEFTSNFKILQEAFSEIGIIKNIEISSLTKGKLNDNLEFLQWLRNYYESNLMNLISYDPVKRRFNNELAPLPLIEKSKKEGSKSVEKISCKVKLGFISLENNENRNESKKHKIVNNLSKINGKIEFKNIEKNIDEEKINNLIHNPIFNNYGNSASKNINPLTQYINNNINNFAVNEGIYICIIFK